MTTQQMPRLAVDAAPLQAQLAVQARVLVRDLDDAAERADTTLSDVGSTPTYDVQARVDPLPSDGRRRGQLFDQRA